MEGEIVMEILKYTAWAIKNYRAVMKNKKAKKDLQKFTISTLDFDLLVKLSKKKAEVDIQLSKAWKEIGDKNGFDFRTVVPFHPHPSPEILALKISPTLSVVTP